LDYELRKKEIIEAYFATGKLTAKVESICYRWYVTNKSNIAQDIEANVWLALSNYNPEKLCAIYDQTGTIENVAVRIAQWQFRIRKNNPDNPNNSFGTKLLYGSSFHNLDSVSSTDTFNDGGDSSSITLYDDDIFNEINYEPDRLEQIYTRLTIKEKQFLEDLLAGVKPFTRKPPNSYKIFKEYVFTKIQNMNLSEPLSPLDNILTKLDMQDVILFNVMFDEDLSYKDKRKALKMTEPQYIAQRRILLKKIKGLNS
jgi:hypothetical protein